MSGPFDAQWNDDAHHVLHVLLTGETEGYYRAYAEAPAEALARSLAEGFVYQGEPFPLRDGAPRGGPSAGLPPTAFVNFVQNHDQIGNRALGERLITLADPKALRAATALILLAPQIPMTFMGEEVGSRSPFLYFTDHNEELAEAVREGRRSEFSHFAAFADPDARAAIPDPNDASTFEASRPEPGPDAAEWRRLYRDLLQIRARDLVPRLRGARSHGARALSPAAVKASWTLGDGARWTLALNLGSEAVEIPDAPERVAAATIGDGLDGDRRLCPYSLVAWLEPKR